MILTDPILVDMLRNAYPFVWYTSKTPIDVIMPRYAKTKASDEIAGIFAYSDSVLLDFETFQLATNSNKDYIFSLGDSQNVAFVLSQPDTHEVLFRYPLKSELFFPVFNDSKLKKIQEKHPHIFDLIAFNQISLLDEEDRANLIEAVENAFTGQWVAPQPCLVEQDVYRSQNIHIPQQIQTDLLLKNSPIPIFQIKDILKLSQVLTQEKQVFLSQNPTQINNTLCYLTHIKAIEAQNESAQNLFNPCLVVIEDYDTFNKKSYEKAHIAYFDSFQHQLTSGLPNKESAPTHPISLIDNGALTLSRLVGSQGLAPQNAKIIYTSVFGSFHPQTALTQQNKKTKMRLDLIEALLNAPFKIDAILICDTLTTDWDENGLVNKYIYQVLSNLSKIPHKRILKKINPLLEELWETITLYQAKMKSSLLQTIKIQQVQEVLLTISDEIALFLKQEKRLSQSDKNYFVTIKTSLSHLFVKDDILIGQQDILTILRPQLNEASYQKSLFKNLFLRLKKRNIALICLDQQNWNHFSAHSMTFDKKPLNYFDSVIYPMQSKPQNTLLIANKQNNLSQSHSASKVVSALAGLFMQGKNKNPSLSINEFFYIASKTGQLVDLDDSFGGYILHQRKLLSLTKAYFSIQNIAPFFSLEMFMEFCSHLQKIIQNSSKDDTLNLKQLKEYILLYTLLKKQKPTLSIQDYFDLIIQETQTNEQGRFIDIQKLLHKIN